MPLSMLPKTKFQRELWRDPWRTLPTVPGDVRPGCCKPHPWNDFKVDLPRDFNGVSLAEVEGEIRFKRAMPGDHLCALRSSAQTAKAKTFGDEIWSET